MRRLAILTLASCALGSAGRAGAEEEPPARVLLLVDPALPAATADAVQKELEQRGAPVEVATPGTLSEPAAEAILSEVRPLYRDMSFKAAAARLDAAEETLIANHIATPGTLRALADVELWLGALYLLESNAAGAQERFALAQRLAPSARPDKIFPPEVASAFAAAQRATPQRVAVTVRVAPTGSRLWVDGKLAAMPLSATVGLHYVVVERADKKVVARVLRLTKAAPEIAVNLAETAPAQEALRQAAARLRAGALHRDEGIGVSAALGRTLWVVGQRSGKLVADRFSASDVARPASALDPADGPAQLAEAFCGSEARCAPPVVVQPGVREPPPSIVAGPPPPPKKPVWKRAWFWGVIGAGVLVLGGAAAGLSIGLTSPRNYIVQVR